MGITIEHSGNFNRTEKFLKAVQKRVYLKKLSKYGEEGAEALAAATPVRSGLTAESWKYEIEESSDGIKIIWSNDNERDGWFNVAIGIQYGHGTRNGGYVEGIDYINPAMRPIFEKIADEVWAEVQGL